MSTVPEPDPMHEPDTEAPTNPWDAPANPPDPERASTRRTMPEQSRTITGGMGPVLVRRQQPS